MKKNNKFNLNVILIKFLLLCYPKPKNKLILKIWGILPHWLKRVMKFLQCMFINFLKWIISMCRFIRIQKITTALLGYQWEPNFNIIEIDITYDCNLSCFSCDRICGQAPTDERMSLGQIRKFVQESIEQNKKWSKITMLGGEPTRHPDIVEIVNILLDYKKKYSPLTIIQLVTNGCGQEIEKVLSLLPADLVIKNSRKESSVQVEFDAVNVAPRDRWLYRYANYSNACDITEKCGIALNMNGYYPCAPAGAIDRIYGYDVGFKRLPSDENMRELLNMLCGHCGHFLCFNKINLKYNSQSWQTALNNYQKNKPKLTTY